MRIFDPEVVVKTLPELGFPVEDAARWDSLTADQKRLYARYMEAYAASLAYADAQIGRVIQRLRDNGEIDNTLIIYIQGDNGASAEGSFDGKLFEQSALSGVKENPDYALSHIDDIGTRHAYNLIPGGWGWAPGFWCWRRQLPRWPAPR